MCRKSIKKKLEPRFAEAQAGKRAVFFVDAAHFVFGAFLGYLWCFARCWIKAPSGRQRFNGLGALHAITQEVITVTNFTYINAESVCQLLRKLSALGLQVPITLVLDNARYQRCALVQSVADTLGIELLYLPAYSPNLNLIERLWKFVKKQCLYSKGCRSHIDVGTLRHAAPGCPVICVSRLTGHRHSGIRVFSYAPHTPEGSPHASIAEPCLLVQ